MGKTKKRSNNSLFQYNGGAKPNARPGSGVPGRPELQGPDKESQVNGLAGKTVYELTYHSTGYKTSKGLFSSIEKAKEFILKSNSPGMLIWKHIGVPPFERWFWKIEAKKIQ
jgi:hypothetical protein